MTRRAVSGAAATLSIAGLTWTRMWRSRAIWVSGVLALAPVLFASVVSGRNPNSVSDVLAISIILLGILPPLHVASSLAEELEDRTAAYLWSRPIPRWSIVSGKMLTLVPFVAVLAIGGALLAAQSIGAVKTMGLYRVVTGLGLGVVAAACCSIGVATLWPKHGMSISMVYILFVDMPIGVVPASLQNISITHHVRSIVGRDGAVTSTALIGLGVISAIWLIVALSRIRKLE